MSNILTQEEIDALLAASSVSDDDEAESSNPSTVFEDEPAPPPVLKQTNKTNKRVSTYDFRRPNKFSKDHMRHIQMIHDNFSRVFKPTLSFQLRENTHLRLIYIEQHTYDEFIDLANNQTLYAILSFHKGRAILGIDIPILLVIIEKLLGGEGDSNLTRRELTDIEMSLYHRLIERIIGCMSEAWGSLVPSTPKVEATESNPQIIQIVSPNEIVLKLVIELGIGDSYTGHITLCYPYVTLSPIIDALGSYQWVTDDLGKTFTAEDEAFLKRRIEKTKVPVVFELGRTMISLGDLMDLNEGDIIKLDRKINDLLPVLIGGKLKFLAQAGTAGKNLAAKIDKVIYPDRDDSYIDRILGRDKKH